MDATITNYFIVINEGKANERKEIVAPTKQVRGDKTLVMRFNSRNQVTSSWVKTSRIQSSVGELVAN